MAETIEGQIRDLPLHATKDDMSGGTYIVTGANTGLGFEAAKHLVSLGAAKVIVACRNPFLGEQAKTDIETATGITGVSEVWTLDLASYASVKAFAKKAETELERIDALIENAAVATAERIMAEGHILPVTVNVTSTFLLGVLLFPKLKESAKKFGITPYLNIVSSGAALGVEDLWNKIKADPIAGTENPEVGLASYPLTKLLEIFAVRHLASLLPVSQTGVVINCLTPGLCVTTLARNAPQAFRDKLKIQHEQHGRTAEEGSRTLLHAIVAGKESHGSYCASAAIANDQLPVWVTNDDGQKSGEHVWEQIAAELEIAEPGCVKQILQ